MSTWRALRSLLYTCNLAIKLTAKYYHPISNRACTRKHVMGKPVYSSESKDHNPALTSCISKNLDLMRITSDTGHAFYWHLMRNGHNSNRKTRVYATKFLLTTEKAKCLKKSYFCAVRYGCLATNAMMEFVTMGPCNFFNFQNSYKSISLLRTHISKNQAQLIAIFTTSVLQ